MPAIVADANNEGHVNLIVHLLNNGPLSALWQELECRQLAFAQLALASESDDRLVWQACQLHDSVLITSNRNDEGDDSLEAVLRELNTSQSLPIVTIGDAQRLMRDRAYAERAASRLLEILVDLDALRGVGRLFIP